MREILEIANGFKSPKDKGNNFWVGRIVETDPTGTFPLDESVPQGAVIKLVEVSSEGAKGRVVSVPETKS